MNSWQEPTL